MIVLDTGVLVYWTLDPKQLSDVASAALIDEQEKVVSSITIWELGQKIKAGDLKLPLRLSDYVDRLNEVDGLKIAPVDEACWIRSLILDWDNEDIADRVIVATSMLQSCRLLSADPIVRNFYSRSLW